MTNINRVALYGFYSFSYCMVLNVIVIYLNSVIIPLNFIVYRVKGFRMKRVEYVLL